MTGFGRGEANNAEAGVSFCTEISSVNKKQFDFRSLLPRELSGYEPILRGLVSEKVSRGAITAHVSVTVNHAGKQDFVEINELAVAALIKKCRKMQEHLDIPGEIKISELLSLPGIIEAHTPDYSSQEIEETFIQSARLALEALLKMRSHEGDCLREDLIRRLESLKDIVEQIKPLAHSIPGTQRERLLQRLRDASLNVDLSDERVLKELVIFSDRSDVSEELTRLDSHFRQFTQFFEKNGEPVGRSLDFLLQEVNREINTLGSKAAGAEISTLVVRFKTELEKIREQVQNVE